MKGSELRENEGQWMYRLGTLRPQGLNEDDGFYAQNRDDDAGDDNIISDIFR